MVSDDAAHFLVDGSLLMARVSDGEDAHESTVELAVGAHALSLYYGQRAGSAFLDFSWKGPGQEEWTTDLSTNFVREFFSKLLEDSFFSIVRDLPVSSFAPFGMAQVQSCDTRASTDRFTCDDGVRSFLDCRFSHSSLFCHFSFLSRFRNKVTQGCFSPQLWFSRFIITISTLSFFSVVA